MGRIIVRVWAVIVLAVCVASAVLAVAVTAVAAAKSPRLAASSSPLAANALRFAPTSRTKVTSHPSGRPLRKVLTADGRVRAHAHGSFSARGYKMVFGKGGAPRFVKTPPATADDAKWSDAFGNIGVGEATTINAVAVSGQDIYIGGSFSALSYDAPLTTNNVAEYNGHGWYPLGSASNNGVNGEVFSLAVSGSTVYVGGSFTSASGKPANAIAAWNGTSWSALGTGMSYTNNTATVSALAVDGSGNVYAGGAFDKAGGVNANSIAKWNGSAWSALGTGIRACGYFDSANHCYDTTDESPGTVNALAFSGTTLYVGGAFNQAGGSVISGLAKWNGSAWSSLGGSVLIEAYGGTGTVNALAVNGSTLYIGGYFDHVGGKYNGTSVSGGVAADSVAEWNGSGWVKLGSGANNCNGCGPSTVSTLAYWNGRLYMSGDFDGAGGDGTPNTAQWNGTSWSTVGANLDGSASEFLPGDGGVLAVGYFNGTADGSRNLYNIGLWDGKNWNGFGLGLSYGLSAGSVGALAASGNDLYAAGNFQTAGDMPALNFAMFDGSNWHSVGGGISGGNGQPYAITVSGSDVYVAGNFTQAGTTPVSNIAMWDGSKWHALGNGVNGTIDAMTMYNGKLWVGGSFSGAGTVNASDVAIWDPTKSTWSAVGSDLHYDGTVYALSGLSGSHYMAIGGNFYDVDNGASQCGCLNVNSIVLFDTTATTSQPFDGYYVLSGAGNSNPGVWSQGSYGPYAGTVNALAFDGATLYIGGSFGDGGNVVSNGFATYDLSTATWGSVGQVGGGDTGGNVNAIYQVGNSYYLAGDFTSAGGILANDVVQYVPSSAKWSALGSGLSGGEFGNSASALVETADGLYVGGGFSLAGAKPSENIALWTGTAFPLTASQSPSVTSTKADSLLTFTATVNNTATTQASGVKLTATLPNTAVFQSAKPSQGTACTRSGVTLSCALGTIAAGGQATVAITVKPILPPNTVNTVSVSETGSSFSSQNTSTVTVAPQANTAYDTVSGTGFAHPSLTLKAGGLVQWDFLTSTAHSVSDPISGCNTASKTGITYYACPYSAAGVYTANEDNATTHQVTINALDRLSKTTIAHGTQITITGDTKTVPTGWGIDYQVLPPGGSWTNIKTASTSGTQTYTPSSAGSYQFRSRLRNLSSGTATGYSPGVTLKAT